jgi:hypothetical protein
VLKQDVNPKQAPATGPDPSKAFFETIQGMVLASIPVLTALVFVVVAIKVFRASMMEITTTVAIVSTADVFALLKGVILTLLPGFLAGLAAASIWWWAGALPERVDDDRTKEAATRGLLSPQAALSWAMIVTAFFTIWWPVYLVLLVPVLATTVVLLPQSLGLHRTAEEPISKRFKLAWFGAVPAGVLVGLLIVKPFLISWPAFFVLLVPMLIVPAALAFSWWAPKGATMPLRRTLRAFGLVTAVAFIGFLTLAPNVWLPLRTITVVGTPLELNGEVLPRSFAAYVLSSDDQGASLLLSEPRAVLQVGPHRIAPAMPLCVPPESKMRALTLRASQVLGVDSDPHSPYEVCPEMPQRFLGGG